MRDKGRPVTGFLTLAVACSAVMAWAAPKEAGQARGADNPQVRVGAYAPDFNLPRLTITNDPTGKPIGIIREADTVRLSSFRGKRPVCLIMSSYT